MSLTGCALSRQCPVIDQAIKIEFPCRHMAYGPANI